MLKKKNLFLIAMTLVCALTFTACGKKEEAKANNKANTSTEEKAPAEANKEKEGDAKAAAPGEDAGFEEFPIGDDQTKGPLVISGVYFQPVDMEPAGNSIPKDCLLYTSPSPRDGLLSRMPSSA